jgi:ABC-type phosphate/phosphonate transport system ATPase subunit
LHQTALAQRFADRIVALRDGRIVLDAAAASLDASEIDRIYGANDEPGPDPVEAPVYAPVASAGKRRVAAAATA